MYESRQKRTIPGNGILFPNLFWLFVRKTCDQQNLLKFEAEGPEFAKFEITRIIQIQISNCEKFENKVFQNEVIENWPFRIKSTTFW